MNKIKKVVFKSISKPKNNIKFNKFLEYKKIRQRQENFKTFLPDFDSISNYIKIWNLKCSVNDYIIRMEKEPLLKLFHLKNPDKQNISEKTQLEYLQSKGLSIYKLPNTGKEAKYLCNGNLITGIENKRKIEIKESLQSTKSLDFVRYINSKTVEYIYAKYTNTCGGSQCNQKNDVIHFINLANEYISKNLVSYKSKMQNRFVALLDGNYYEKNIINELERYIKYPDYIYIRDSESL